MKKAGAPGSTGLLVRSKIRDSALSAAADRLRADDEVIEEAILRLR